MLTAQAGPGIAEETTEEFAVEDLWELQRRRGKFKQPAISYEQRDSLRRKCIRRDSVVTVAVRSLIGMVQSMWGGLAIILSAESFDSWLNFVMRGTCSRSEDIMSGRARMDRMRFGASANGVGSIRGPGEFYSRSFDAIRSRNLP